MDFRYLIEYQNKQQRTVTVVYIPSDNRALAVARVISYNADDTSESLHKRIVAEAPIAEWEQACCNQDSEFALGEFHSNTTEVATAIASLNPPPTFEDLKWQKSVQIDEWRVQAERRGMPYTFPDGSQDVVQVRHERDLANINGLVATAMVLQDQGVSEPVLAFRAASNSTYNMTPGQVIELGVAVGEFTAQQYRIAWGLKEMVREAQDLEALSVIQWPTPDRS